MSCIHEYLIQKYIDGEAGPEEALYIENHIATCKKCELKVENQRKLAAGIKNALNSLAKSSMEIPEFVIPQKRIKTPVITLKRFSIIMAAASILIFVFVITGRKELNNSIEIALESDFTPEVDANRSVSQFPLIINIIDTEGNIYEYSVK